MTTAANPANWLTGTIAELPTPLDTVLNHWDETLAYAGLYCLVNGVFLSAA